MRKLRLDIWGGGWGGGAAKVLAICRNVEGIVCSHHTRSVVDRARVVVDIARHHRQIRHEPCICIVKYRTDDPEEGEADKDVDRRHEGDKSGFVL